MNPSTNKLVHGANATVIAIMLYAQSELSAIKSDVATLKEHRCRCGVTDQAATLPPASNAILTNAFALAAKPIHE